MATWSAWRKRLGVCAEGAAQLRRAAEQLRAVSECLAGSDDDEGRAAVAALASASEAVERAKQRLFEALQASQVKTHSEVTHG